MATVELKEFGKPVAPVELDRHPQGLGYRLAKRAFDTVFTGLLLLLLLPLFAVIALAVKLSSPGPIIYRSERIGLRGKPFNFLKFRSMYVDADQRLLHLLGENEKDGPIFKMKDDPRITKVGKFLRKYSLDELPQLISVFKGEMALVGPRPPIRREVEQYDERCLARLTVKPGITCYWQVGGRSNLTFQEWMDLDLKYIEDASLLTDFKILLKTPAAVLRGEGAF